VRLIARRALEEFADRHPDARLSLTVWRKRVIAAKWGSMADIQAAFPKAKVLDGERARFEIQGGDFRLIAAFDFTRQIAFVKFIGTHAEYDKIDALTVARY
jgi:mRNA interferase HigB